MRFPISSRSSAFGMTMPGGTRSFAPDPRYVPGYRAPTMPSGYVPGYRGTPAPVSPGRWVSPPSGGYGYPPGGSYGSYGGWMKNAKFFNKFLRGALANVPTMLLEAGWAQWIDGFPFAGRSFVLPPGWQLNCAYTNMMPLQAVGVNGGSQCNVLIWTDAQGIQFFEPTAYPYKEPVYWPQGGGWQFGYGQQLVPGPNTSAQPLFLNVSFSAPGIPGADYTYWQQNYSTPRPSVTTIPDDRWPADMQPMLTPVVPGSSGVALPFGIAAAAAGFSPLPSLAPGAAPGAGVAPGVGPGAGAGPGVTPSPGVNPKPDPRGPLPRGRPFKNGKPPKGTGEKKWLVGGPLGAALKLAQAAGEANDFFNALWWALSPASRKAARKAYGHKPTPLERWAWVMSHPGDIDPEKAIDNLINNQVGDTVGGMIGEVTKQWHAANWSHGWDSRGRGPAELAKKISKFIPR